MGKSGAAEIIQGQFREFDDQGTGLSRRILNLDWKNHFPLILDSEGVFVEYVSYEVGMKFILENYPRIYPPTNSEHFLKEGLTEARKNYYTEAGDFFLFKHGDKPVGVFVGTMIDWSSYYLRTCAMFPEYRGNGRYQKLFGHLLEVLRRCGVERAEGDIPPTNLPHIHIFNKFGFNITGFSVSERWGALIHFTRFLQEKNQSIFNDQFCVAEFVQKSKVQKIR